MGIATSPFVFSGAAIFMPQKLGNLQRTGAVPLKSHLANSTVFRIKTELFSGPVPGVHHLMLSRRALGEILLVTRTANLTSNWLVAMFYGADNEALFLISALLLFALQNINLPVPSDKRRALVAHIVYYS